MPNPRLAARYAKSLVDLAAEKGQLEKVYADMQYLQALTKQSRDFLNVLKSPVFTADKKLSFTEAVTKGKVSELTALFIKLLISKGREADLPEIAAAWISQYNERNNICRVTLTTATPASEELKKLITAKLKSEAGLDKVELETKVNADIIGGFVLEYNNNLVDASVLRDLNDIKKQFSGNVYEQLIR
jgi:F-type H+-transporting ATPase subunit delta